MNDQDKTLAALYVANELPEQQEIEFARKLAQDPQLIMQTIAQAINIPEQITEPPLALRETLFERVFLPEKAESALRNFQDRNSQAVVVADPSGLVEWVSPAFTRMCGYTLEELKGTKAGRMLQGADTDPKAVEILRTAIREVREATAQLVNYHKRGDAYHVNIWLEPLRSEAGDLVGFVAVETQL